MATTCDNACRACHSTPAIPMCAARYTKAWPLGQPRHKSIATSASDCWRGRLIPRWRNLTDENRMLSMCPWTQSLTFQSYPLARLANMSTISQIIGPQSCTSKQGMEHTSVYPKPEMLGSKGHGEVEWRSITWSRRQKSQLSNQFVLRKSSTFDRKTDMPGFPHVRWRSISQNQGRSRQVQAADLHLLGNFEHSFSWNQGLSHQAMQSRHHGEHAFPNVSSP